MLWCGSNIKKRKEEVGEESREREGGGSVACMIAQLCFHVTP